VALINNNFLAKQKGMYPGGGGVYIPPGPGPTPAPLYGVITPPAPTPTPGPTPVPLYGVVRALYAVPAPVEYQQLDQ
jgi:hypothetical protein